MVNWSQLPIDLLVEITKRLTLYEDFVAFGSVCSSWRSVAIMEKLIFLSKRIPWLMIAQQKPTDQRGFFSVSEDLTRNVVLPEVNFRRYFSSRGWLLTIAKKDLSMALLHPFSRFEIELPRMKTFKHWNVSFITKFFLSFNPMCTSDYVVMVLYSRNARVAYSKSGDKSWTTIRTPRVFCYDITYYKGQYYVINDVGQILRCDFATNVTVEVARMPHRTFSTALYMLESARALLVVERDGVVFREIQEGSGEYTYRTTGFRVFQVDLRNNIWTEIKDVGNRTLFLGYNSSFSVEASICKSNCIYFTDDCRDADGDDGWKDMGIYNILDGSIKPHFQGSSYGCDNPPVWVQQEFY